VEIGDGDLVRLARDGDQAAFRLLVERHQPMARARAARLGADQGEAEDVVQEAFLRAFVALGQLQDPDRFAGWLGGIVLNVHRGMRRRVAPVLLADWPERLHPASPVGLPSADDLDRADALRTAVAGLPAGQRRAVEMFYYADQPAAEIGASPGAAKASLHKARRQLRAYIAAHRPDLIPGPRRTPMTAVRIARVEPRPGDLGDGRFLCQHVIVVLADDARQRALPIWLTGPDGEPLWRLLDPPVGGAGTASVPAEVPAEAFTAGLLRAAGITVTAVGVEELGPEVTAARIELAGPGGARQVTGGLGPGLALAAATGAPVRVAGELMDRLAEPAGGDDDPVGPFLARRLVPVPPAYPGPRWRYEPRNLAFADGLDCWEFGGSFQRHASGAHWQDYSCTAAGGSAILSSAVPDPHGFVTLRQGIFAEDYRGRAVVFRGEIRTEDVASRAGLFLRVVTDSARPGRDDRDDQRGRGDHLVTVTGSHGWTRHEVTAEIPGNAVLIRFGVFLSDRGRVELRNAELTRGA
jgi:RNA polymerase sigma-70 factor, ECF subfamily